ncbi:hypothetical protein [Streptomyces vietnamensis]|uniref:Uncharacterized protein n=1 Tax=Streptomyces vietnamensis TaxID=362257 RepID=A0A0B5IEP8_9ACTN|nr:hypothetical protein [Streptomyces vietnamensis]AJF68178.1 hypothetical protein SVTN_31255 [Streptomyces vietnamensis]
MTDTPYGVRGCRCVRVQEGGAVYRWDRDTTCPYHGLLPRDRTDTGIYRGVDLSTPPLDGSECPPGIHSIFDPCAGGCLNDNEDAAARHYLVWRESKGLPTARKAGVKSGVRHLSTEALLLPATRGRARVALPLAPAHHDADGYTRTGTPVLGSEEPCIDTDDCRCAECGTCRHDHRGFAHTWTTKGPAP